MKEDNTRRVGKAWEGFTADYLKDKGYIILYMNYRTRFSEIDIIAQDRDELIFIEVKYRQSMNSGDPLEAVNYRKQRRIRNAALSFLRDNNYDIDNTAIRFDVIGILGNEVRHIKNAF
ncbi:MAG: YraN family protein [Eubacterium sp.]|nr:YraN family protein [Eubacterium sp.]